MRKSRIKILSHIVEESGPGRNKIFTSLDAEETAGLKELCNKLCRENPKSCILSLNTETGNVLDSFLAKVETNTKYNKLDLGVIKEVFCRFYLSQIMAEALGIQSKTGGFPPQKILSAYKNSDVETVQRAYQLDETDHIDILSYAKDNGNLLLYVFEENMDSRNLQGEINDYISMAGSPVTMIVFTNQKSLVHYQTNSGRYIEATHDYSDMTSPCFEHAVVREF